MIISDDVLNVGCFIWRDPSNRTGLARFDMFEVRPYSLRRMALFVDQRLPKAKGGISFPGLLDEQGKTRSIPGFPLLETFSVFEKRLLFPHFWPRGIQFIIALVAMNHYKVPNALFWNGLAR